MPVDGSASLRQLKPPSRSGGHGSLYGSTKTRRKQIRRCVIFPCVAITVKAFVYCQTSVLGETAAVGLSRAVTHGQVSPPGVGLREDASTHQSFRTNDWSVHEETETDDAKKTTLDDDEGTPEQWKLAAEELVDRIRWNLPQEPPAPPVRLTSGDGDFPRPTNTAHAKRTMPGGDHARSGAVPDGGWKDLAADTEKREHVKKSMVDAYDAYEKYAFGWDELRPLSKRGKNAFGGLGATIIDSLDTLWIMGLSDHYSRARNWVDEFLFFDRDWEASLFETTIRVLGGLLSAYDLSGDEMYLRKCLELADKLEPAFGTKTGVPLNIVNLKTGETKTPPWTGGPSAVVLSEFGSLAMEFGALSERVGDKKWVTLAETPVKVAIAHSSKRNLPKNVRP